VKAWLSVPIKVRGWPVLAAWCAGKSKAICLPSARLCTYRSHLAQHLNVLAMTTAPPNDAGDRPVGCVHEREGKPQILHLASPSRPTPSAQQDTCADGRSNTAVRMREAGAVLGSKVRSSRRGEPMGQRVAHPVHRSDLLQRCWASRRAPYPYRRSLRYRTSRAMYEAGKVRQGW
jgi:hypothetical protein